MTFETQEDNFTDKEIGGVCYSISRFSPTPAVKLSTRLAKFLGPAIVAGISEIKATGKKDIKASDINFAKLIDALLPNLDEDLVSNTIKDLVSCVSVNGTELKAANYENHFRGTNLKNLFPLVGAVVEYQFADFLSGLLTGKNLSAMK